MCFSVRKEPPAFGDKNSWNQNFRSLLDLYYPKLTCIMEALDQLLEFYQLLPEEYAELWLYRRDNSVMSRILKDLCNDSTIPESNREFMCLVIFSFNEHVFETSTIPENLSHYLSLFYEYKKMTGMNKKA